MTIVAGASRYYATSTLANKSGSVISAPNILGGSSATSLLDVGRKDTGIGLSGNARAINSQLTSQSRAGFNKIFSLNGVEFGNNETLIQKIKAIRAGIPESRLSRDTLGDILDEKA